MKYGIKYQIQFTNQERDPSSGNPDFVGKVVHIGIYDMSFNKRLCRYGGS